MKAYNMKDFRLDFPLLSREYKNKRLVYFDNAATSPKPQIVIEAVLNFYKNHNANIHRGPNFLSEEATNLYEEARHDIARFINTPSTDTIIFTSGATASLNLIARAWGEANLKKGDIVVLGRAEHHANIVPWLQLKDKLGIEIQYLDIDENGELMNDRAYTILEQPRVKLVSLSQASNVLGIYYDLKPIIKFAKDRGIITVIDASQSLAHRSLNVEDLGADFLVFSGHKLFAPSGIGVLYGRKELLEAMPAFFGGGGMISSVSEESYQSAELPDKFEAGTPNIEGAIGLGAACRYLTEITWAQIESRELKLVNHFLDKLKYCSSLSLLGGKNRRLPLFSFKLDRLHPHDLADLLGEEGIITRAGHHCAEPLHRHLGINASLRLSLAFYNSIEEIDLFFDKYKEIEDRLSF